jgi:hypothetical protein
MAQDMDLVLNYGQTGPNTKENGVSTKQMEEESFGMQTVISMKVFGKMIKQMDMEFIFM